jgi:hypothetical protein
VFSAHPTSFCGLVYSIRFARVLEHFFGYKKLEYPTFNKRPRTRLHEHDRLGASWATGGDGGRRRATTPSRLHRILIRSILHHDFTLTTNNLRLVQSPFLVWSPSLGAQSRSRAMPPLVASGLSLLSVNESYIVRDGSKLSSLNSPSSVRSGRKCCRAHVFYYSTNRRFVLCRFDSCGKRVCI